jgi:hypothetical protein
MENNIQDKPCPNCEQLERPDHLCEICDGIGTIERRMQYQSLTIEIKSPVPCTEEEFKQWIRYKIGHTYCIPSDNTLLGHELNTKHLEWNE